MRQWGEGVIDRLDEAAVADGGGLVTALAAALARTPARSFTSFMQGTAGTVSLLDGRVRGEISDGLSQVVSDPGLIGRAARDDWRSRTLADMAADLYANGVAGAMMGGADQRYIVASATPSDRKERHWGILVMTFPYLTGMGHKVLHGVPERMAHRVANGREFDSAQAGGLVRNLPIEGVRITDRGAGVVERHISRSQSEDANNFMIERLRRIAQISLKPTERDLNYHYARIEGICQIQAFGGGNLASQRIQWKLTDYGAICMQSHQRIIDLIVIYLTIRGQYMLNSGEILLLKLIRGNAGEFNFYTLDRAARRNGWRDLNDGYLLGAFYSLIDRKYVLAKKQKIK